MSVIDYLKEQSKLPFVWGQTDCVHLTGGMVEQFGGANPAAGYSYATEREARRIIEAAGSLRALVTKHLGEPRAVSTHGGLIQEGDIVLATYEDTGEILGIATPPKFWMRRIHQLGLVPAPLEQALWFWNPCLL